MAFDANMDVSDARWDERDVISQKRPETSPKMLKPRFSVLKVLHQHFSHFCTRNFKHYFKFCFTTGISSHAHAEIYYDEQEEGRCVPPCVAKTCAERLGLARVVDRNRGNRPERRF